MKARFYKQLSTGEIFVVAEQCKTTSGEPKLICLNDNLTWSNESMFGDRKIEKDFVEITKVEISYDQPTPKRITVKP